MFCCKKRKARKAAKAQAIVSSLAAVESALEGKTAEMFAEKLTGNKKALKKAQGYREDRSCRREGTGSD